MLQHHHRKVLRTPTPRFGDIRGHCPSSSVSFVETEHGRLRRRQRGIDKKDLQAAIRYGTRRGTHPRPNGDRSGKYTYKGIVYILNEVTGEEITCYAEPIGLEPVPLTEQMLRDHYRAMIILQNRMESWTSNSVIVVDTSGSMREADVWGSRNRLQAVWMSLALDFVACRLESGEGGASDVVSVVTLGVNPQIIIEEHPCTWVLYNKLVEIYNNKEVPPHGHGPFLPSLQIAERLLLRNMNASCAMNLTFLSDGVPSDVYTRSFGPSPSHDECAQRIEDAISNLARKFGRRLTFQAIAIGDLDDFSMLQRMVDAAKDFGTHAELCRPSMSTIALGEVFTTVATSVTSTQRELTDHNTMKQQEVRPVNRVSRKKANEELQQVSTVDFDLYSIAKVKRRVYTECLERDPNGHGYVRRPKYENAPLQHPDARYVAFEKGPFGEGAERFAFRFFELAANARTIVGKPLVAKESRLILEKGVNDEDQRKKFVQTFCSTQQLARRLAHKFNKKLDSTYGVDVRTPRVTFLDCSIYELKDMYLGKVSVLVEEKLDHFEWRKWNSNNGYVEGMKTAPEYNDFSIREAMENMTAIAHFETITEEEEESDDEGSKENANDRDWRSTTRKKIRPPAKKFSPFEVAQAFSHFTYMASHKKRLVCDLQGVFCKETNSLMFSDPVIHYWNPYSGDSTPSSYRKHGSTDHGKKGMAKFFDTHKEHCGHLCRLVTRGFRKVHGARHSTRATGGNASSKSNEH